MCGPGVITVLARSGAVAPPYGVPAASAADIRDCPVELIVTGCPSGSSAKSLSRPVIAEPAVVQVELSSSAMNASLNWAADEVRVLLREEAEVERQAVGPGRDGDRDRQHRRVERRVAASGRRRPAAVVGGREGLARHVGLVGLRGVPGREHGVGRAVGGNGAIGVSPTPAGVPLGGSDTNDAAPMLTPAAGSAPATAAGSLVGVIVAPADAATASMPIATSTASVVQLLLPLIPEPLLRRHRSPTQQRWSTGPTCVLVARSGSGRNGAGRRPFDPGLPPLGLAGGPLGARQVAVACLDRHRLLALEVAHRTVPRVTFVNVPSQRSSTSQIVPRTVAALYLPSVRNLPLPLPHSFPGPTSVPSSSWRPPPLPRALQRRALRARDLTLHHDVGDQRLGLLGLLLGHACLTWKIPGRSPTSASSRRRCRPPRSAPRGPCSCPAASRPGCSPRP